MINSIKLIVPGKQPFFPGYKSKNRLITCKELAILTGSFFDNSSQKWYRHQSELSKVFTLICSEAMAFL